MIVSVRMPNANKELYTNNGEKIFRESGGWMAGGRKFEVRALTRGRGMGTRGLARALHMAKLYLLCILQRKVAAEIIYFFQTLNIQIYAYHVLRKF
jgi:hypothetical protein